MHTLKTRPATPRGRSGGSTAIYFLREKEGLESVQTLVQIATGSPSGTLNSRDIIQAVFSNG